MYKWVMVVKGLTLIYISKNGMINKVDQAGLIKGVTEFEFLTWEAS